MSDEEQTPTPGDESPTPEDSQTRPDDATEPAAEGESAEQPELDEDAAKALAAAQAAVSAAMSDENAEGDAGAEPTPEELEMLSAMQQTVDETSGATGQVLGGQPTGEQPTPFSAPSFAPTAPEADDAEIEMLGDVNVDVRIELGRTRMLVEDVLRLGEGAVVELEKLAGDPVDVYVNGRHVARGEVLVLNENFCVRVNEVIEPLPAGKQAD